MQGHYIFDTTSAKLVWEHPYFPHYWIPKKDFADDAEFDIGGRGKAPGRVSFGQGKTPVVSVAVVVVPQDTSIPELKGHVKIEFKSLDAWFEEDVQIYYHPKDPYHRVDVLPTSRHVRVELDGVVLADTKATGGVVSLWETGFPARWYIPRTSVNWQALKPSNTVTGCPYKGQASYYDAVLSEKGGGKEEKRVADVAWWYRNPTPECTHITGLLCFYPDKVVTVVDGKEIERVGMPMRQGVDPKKMGNANV